MTIALLLAALLGGCSREPGPPIPREKFVETMVELRQAAAASQNAEFEAKRQAILARQGVTDAQLRAFVKWAARDPDRMREAFDQVSAALQPKEVEE